MNYHFPEEPLMKIKIISLTALIVLFGLVAMVQADENNSPLTQDDLDYVNENLPTLYDAGILEGYPDGEFDGENIVTRFEAGVVLTRFYTYILDELNNHGVELMDFVDIRNPFDTPMDMDDIPESHWAYQEVRQLEHMGVASGYPGLEYMGSKEITRYEFAAMLLRVVVLVDFAIWEAVPGYDAGFQYTHYDKPETIENAPDEYWAQADVRRLIDAGDPELSPEGELLSENTTFNRYEMVYTILGLLDNFQTELDGIEAFLNPQ
jgi:hypothetical protein